MAPSATSGIAFVSNGSSSQPSFTTVGTAGGGTGLNATPGNSTLLATNASGTLAYRAFSVSEQVFTSSGTYTPTTGMISCKIICLGGGGGGGGAATTGAGQLSQGGGGGSGEYAVGYFSAATVGASQTITIAAAASGGSGTTGGNGGTSSVGSLITAFGGSGGTTNAANAEALAAGGAGGTGGAGGDYRTPGSIGGLAVGTQGNSTNITFTGPGASSQLGSGGSQLIGAAGAGNNAAGYGSGGSGASNFASSGSTRAGGNATKGIIIIEEYIIA